eukprot:6630272-Alexandrium_andersonii.AAC.1
MLRTDRGPQPLIVLGDLNARIYHTLPGEEGAFGPFPVFAGRAGRGIPQVGDLRDPTSNRGLLLACCRDQQLRVAPTSVSYTHLRAHETSAHL